MIHASSRIREIHVTFNNTSDSAKFKTNMYLIKIQASEMEPPTLFELAEIDDDGGVAEGASGMGESAGRSFGASGSGGKERQHSMSEVLLQFDALHICPQL